MKVTWEKSLSKKKKKLGKNPNNEKCQIQGILGITHFHRGLGSLKLFDRGIDL